MATGALALSLAACVGSRPAISPAVLTYSRGLPPATTPGRTEPIAAWAGPRRIYVVVWGSGSCPQLPTTVFADRRNHVTVHTDEQNFGADACTADLAPTTSTSRCPRVST